MSALKKAIPFVVLGGVAAMVGGGIYAYNRAEAKQKAERDQAFTDLSQCLLGDIVPSGDDTMVRMTLVRGRIAHRSEAALAGDDGKAWPQRCAGITRDMSDSVRTSSFLDETAKRDLLKELEQLQKELEAPNAINTDLGLPMLALWRVVEKHGVRVTPSSSVAGPPMLTLIDGIGELPFEEIRAIYNGPVRAFLVSLKIDPNKTSLCVVADDGLECRGLDVEGSMTPLGTWSSVTAIPFWDGEEVQILRDGKAEPIGAKLAGAEPKVHVDERGTAFLLGVAFGDEDVKPLLVVKPAGGKAKSVNLEKALDRASDGASADAVTATLLANNVMIRRTAADGISGSLQTFAISDDAKLAEPVSVPSKGSTDLIPLNCRIASGYAVDMSLRQSALMFWEGGKWAGPVSPRGRHSFNCAPSGVWVSESTVCTATGCVDVLDKERWDALISAGASPSTTRFGDSVVAAWAVRENGGVVVQVSKVGEKKPQTEVLIAEKTDSKSRTLVWGDETGAVVAAEVAGHLLGARVKADGSVVPLRVTLK
jgi:hypothetical protein